MLSLTSVRILCAAVAFVLLASLPVSAQCIVRCASPAPPKCHHHSPDKQATIHVCADAVAFAQQDISLAAPSAVAAVVIVSGAAAPVASHHPFQLPPHRVAPAVLRI